MRLGDTIKELLEQQGLTQKEMAQILDISPSAFGNYVQNTREPDYHTLKRIADYFQVTTDFLLDYPDKSGLDHNERLLIHIFRSLTEDQQEFFLEQGKIFIRQNKKKRYSPSPGAESTEVC